MTKTCHIYILDEVNCSVQGLSNSHLNHFYDELSLMAPNHFFSPKYKLGVWDGKIRYFKKTGHTFVNLLDGIIPTIVKMGYTIDLRDQRKAGTIPTPVVDANIFSHLVNPHTNEPMTLRPYQVELIQALIEYGNGVGIASTGSGKTAMSAALALAYERAAGFRSIIIVPDKNLTEQTRSEYEFFGLDVGEYSGTRKDVNKQHIVATWQTLQNNPNFIQNFQVVIADECFDKNTPILMGDETYKDICDVKIGDVVKSYNIQSCQFENDVVVQLHTNLSKSSEEKMYEMEFDDGTIIKMTGNHPVLTTNGYVRADMLTENHDIISFNLSTEYHK